MLPTKTFDAEHADASRAGALSQPGTSRCGGRLESHRERARWPPDYSPTSRTWTDDSNRVPIVFDQTVGTHLLDTILLNSAQTQHMCYQWPCAGTAPCAAHVRVAFTHIPFRPTGCVSCAAAGQYRANGEPFDRDRPPSSAARARWFENASNAHETGFRNSSV